MMAPSTNALSLPHQVACDLRAEREEDRAHRVGGRDAERAGRERRALLARHSGAGAAATRPASSSRVWRGRKYAKPPTTTVTAASTQKLRCSGAGAYCTSAPPTMVASARPVAVAAVVAELARRAPSRPPNSTIAAVAGLSESPTPTPMSARPMNTQVRSGARPNAIDPSGQGAESHEDDRPAADHVGEVAEQR